MLATRTTCRMRYEVHQHNITIQQRNINHTHCCSYCRFWNVPCSILRTHTIFRTHAYTLGHAKRICHRTRLSVALEDRRACLLANILFVMWHACWAEMSLKSVSVQYSTETNRNLTFDLLLFIFAQSKRISMKMITSHITIRHWSMSHCRGELLVSVRSLLERTF